MALWAVVNSWGSIPDHPSCATLAPIEAISLEAAWGVAIDFMAVDQGWDVVPCTQKHINEMKRKATARIL